MSGWTITVEYDPLFWLDPGARWQYVLRENGRLPREECIGRAYTKGRARRKGEQRIEQILADRAAEPELRSRPAFVFAYKPKEEE